MFVFISEELDVIKRMAFPRSGPLAALSAPATCSTESITVPIINSTRNFSIAFIVPVQIFSQQEPSEFVDRVNKRRALGRVLTEFKTG